MTPLKGPTMTENEKDKEQLKDLLHLMKMVRANIENWKYVEANKHLLPRERLEQTIEQMTGMFDPMMMAMQMSLEIQALDTLDPIDLL
jgi:hypothetical protein